MGRNSGGAGGASKRTGSVKNSEYGDSVKVVKNTSPNPPVLSFASNANASLRIVVNPVTSGTEKQIQYANSVKSGAMQYVDSSTQKAMKMGANRERSIATRNKIMKALNADTNARSILDKLSSGYTMQDIYNAYGK